MSSAVKNYRDLIIWQRGIELVKEIYLITKYFPAHKTYGLSNQIQRAAVSIPSNIAEGQARKHTSEFKHFLFISLGSLAEVDTQLVIARELEYVTDEEIGNTEKMILELRKMIYTLVKNLPEN